MKKAVLAIAVAAAFVLLGRVYHEDEVADLQFWCYGVGGAKDHTPEFWDAVIRAFTEANPGIRIKAVTDVPHAPYLSMLTTRFIGGNPPDVIIVDDGDIGPLATEGLIMSLEGFIRADPACRPEDFPPSMVRDGYVGSERYSIPWAGGFGCIYYRRDLLAEADVPPPRTWRELLEVCRALQQKAAMPYPFAMDPKAAFWLMPWVWQNGARIMSDDQCTVTIDTPEFVEAVAFVRDLMYRHGVMDPALARGAKVNDLWSSGAAAIVIDGSWKIGRYDELFPQWKGMWDVAPVPAGRWAVSFFGGQHLVMSRQTRRPELAWKFMVFATSPENQRLYSTITGFPPGNLCVYQMPGYLEQQPYMRIVPEVIRTGRNNPFAPFFRNIWYELFQNRVLDVVMTDSDADIAQAVRETAREMQAVADRYWATHDYFIQGAPDKKDEG